MLSHFAKTIAITLSKIGTTDPKLASTYLPLIIKPWCISLRYLNNKDEKETAFKGLCAMIPHNPLGIADSFPYFCEALVEFTDPPNKLEKVF